MIKKLHNIVEKKNSKLNYSFFDLKTLVSYFLLVYNMNEIISWGEKGVNRIRDESIGW